MKNEFLILEISRHHGIDSDTVAYMLQSWVMTLAGGDHFIDAEVVEELQDVYDLSAEQIERASTYILNALEGAGVHLKLANRRAFLYGVNVIVHRDIAELHLFWG